MKPSLLACAVTLGIVAAAAAPMFAAQDRPKPADSRQSAAPPPVTSYHPRDVQDEGERIFQQNCARCHNAPEGFSSRIAGTIVRHMRVRANLSPHDEKVLLQFFNP